MKGDKWKLFKKFATVFTSLFAIFGINLANTSTAFAFSASSFGIAQYNLNGTWTSPFSSNESGSTQIVSGGVASFKGLNGIRFVRYANWGDGRYFGGNANLAVTFRQPASATDYNYVVDTNTSGWSILCGNGSSFAAPQSLSITNFSIFKNDWGDNGTYKYFTMNYSFNFSGTFSSAQSGGYDFYCSIQKNGGFGTIRYAATNIYYENTIVTMNAFASESEVQLGQVIAQNQTMINQNSTIIGQNQQIINQDNQDRSDIQDVSDSADSNADTAQSQNEGATSNLLNLMGSFIEALQTPATNCRVPADLGNLDLGTIDFCTGKPAEFVPIINTISALVMSFAIYLVARHLVHSFIRITVFAQGGKD